MWLVGRACVRACGVVRPRRQPAASVQRQRRRRHPRHTLHCQRTSTGGVFTACCKQITVIITRQGLAGASGGRRQRSGDSGIQTASLDACLCHCRRLSALAWRRQRRAARCRTSDGNGRRRRGRRRRRARLVATSHPQRAFCVEPVRCVGCARLLMTWSRGTFQIWYRNATHHHYVSWASQLRLDEHRGCHDMETTRHFTPIHDVPKRGNVLVALWAHTPAKHKQRQ